MPLEAIEQGYHYLSLTITRKLDECFDAKDLSDLSLILSKTPHISILVENTKDEETEKLSFKLQVPIESMIEIVKRKIESESNSLQ